MEFTFTTLYDRKACSDMAKALRKTIRKKHSRRSHIFGWIVVALVVLLSLPQEGEKYIIDAQRIVTWVAALTIVGVFCFEDKINGAVARRRMLPGLISSVTTFEEEMYHSETEVGTTQFKYDNIITVAETARYFVFIFSQNHAQVYDKKLCSDGDPDAFRAFIESKTGCTTQYIR